jgi:hypothetical protein
LVGHLLGAALKHHADMVDQGDVFALQAHGDHKVQAGDPGGAAARGHHLDLRNVLSDHAQAVGQRGADDDRGAVLVVVEHGDSHTCLQFLFQDETVGRLEIFQIDGAEGRLHGGDDVDQLFRIGFVQLDIEHVDSGKFLE